MKTFRCDRCEETFEAEGTKQEWESGTYGPCFKYVSECPSCGAECGEFQPRPRGTKSPPSCCGSGGCCVPRPFAG